jgi:thioredoxin-related protein
MSVFLYLLTIFSPVVAETTFPVTAAADITAPGFDDSPLKEAIVLPDWFKLSFLDINEDLQDARDAEKHGLIIYFGQKRCPYCKALLEVNFAKNDIVAYTQKYFDIIAIDVHGGKMVTDVNGNMFSEREFSRIYETSFTPSLLFYDLDGHLALRLTGYHSPYKFKAALQYVAEGYYRSESFRDYLQRAPISVAEGREGLNQRFFFLPPPHMLARNRMKAARPLVVFFERNECHACDVLHEGPLGNDANLMKIREFEAVQVDIESGQPIVTPSGQEMTMNSWAEQLDIFHVPTLVFFDERGNEIIRVDSLIHFYRMRNLLDYILTNGYRKYGNYLMWRRAGPPKQ